MMVCRSGMHVVAGRGVAHTHAFLHCSLINLSKHAECAVLSHLEQRIRQACACQWCRWTCGMFNETTQHKAVCEK